MGLENDRYTSSYNFTATMPDCRLYLRRDEMKDRNEILNALRKGDVVVEFTKVNGDYRKMICTLNESVLPPATKDDSVTQKKVREVNPEVCVVYDVNAKGWRSFRWDSVIEANPDVPF